MDDSFLEPFDQLHASSQDFTPSQFSFNLDRLSTLPKAEKTEYTISEDLVGGITARKDQDLKLLNKGEISLSLAATDIGTPRNNYRSSSQSPILPAFRFEPTPPPLEQQDRSRLE